MFNEEDAVPRVNQYFIKYTTRETKNEFSERMLSLAIKRGVQNVTPLLIEIFKSWI